MPIRKDLKRFYGEDWDTVVRPRIMKRAKDCCERCGKPDRREVIVVNGSGIQYWIAVVGGRLWRDCWGDYLSKPPVGKPKKITVVISVAHLNHVSGDDRDENLEALCQYCHLAHDKKKHAQARMARKDALRPVLVLVGDAGIPVQPAAEERPMGILRSA
jgi:hypothetical protein